MKNHHTIWESAKRPLYVRSVWIESERHRHFILDYETNRNYNDLQNLKSKKKVIKQSVSCDHFEETETVSTDSLKLIGSPKKQCQPSAVIKSAKLPSNSHKLSFPSQKSFLNMFKSHKEKQEDQTGPIFGSKRNSLQEVSVNSNQFNDTSTSDEKLAERVLNWLDLAGKTPLIRPNTASVDTSSPTKPVSPPSAVASSKKDKPLIPKIRNKTAIEKRPDSVKHITIIFNKEGMPVRYNRPLRYADLFGSGFTASKKFANSLTSRYGRTVYNSTSQSSTSFENHQMTNGKSTPDNVQKNPKIRVENTKNNFTNDYKPMINKQILQESCNLYEVKKQLHIFMPSLPKKTSPPTAVTPSDCASLISAVLSDQCKS